MITQQYVSLLMAIVGVFNLDPDEHSFQKLFNHYQLTNQ